MNLFPPILFWLDKGDFLYQICLWKLPWNSPRILSLHWQLHGKLGNLHDTWGSMRDELELCLRGTNPKPSKESYVHRSTQHQVKELSAVFSPMKWNYSKNSIFVTYSRLCLREWNMALCELCNKARLSFGSLCYGNSHESPLTNCWSSCARFSMLGNLRGMKQTALLMRFILMLLFCGSVYSLFWTL